MKLIISDPQTGCTKLFEVDDEKKLLPFYEKRIGAEVTGDSISPDFTGYVLRVTGGNDKQGFPMMQGVLVNHRVRLLFKKGMPCYRERRAGSMKRKSVRGCIVAPDISALNLTVVRRGEKDIEGLTDSIRPRRLGPKRANHIRKLFGLEKVDDPRPFVVRRVIKEGKKTKAPKIQRLVTPTRLRRKKAYRAELKRRSEKSKAEAEEFKHVIEKYVAEKKEKAHAAKVSRHQAAMAKTRRGSIH
eukprot:Gregarina_sp_Pseudo_9__2243@NODE_2579_length_946_cov_564_751929_g2364_i0_p1_GENE_NODE_2579_length_946_cov_564_751929_g2364_i0NODE_2579_length_946_cov_564_751929_g2364_i0_p1_ORF_typecomplete_len243_score73_53Ribosomal_S6e/PF01092_19/4_2e51Ribosomal_S6e/PF01092_19/2_7e03MRVI1/PF05781_12/0_16CBP4/PF07960_11/0_41CBFB_NFYA/PF02045_15/0_87_NODE_2579_length_946_cov_564_751929_g2364_i057785